jgi:translocation and assembly module TamB
LAISSSSRNIKNVGCFLDLYLGLLSEWEIQRMAQSNREQPKRSFDEVQPWRFILSRTGLFFSILSSSVLMGGVAGANWSRLYAETLTPQIAQLLSETLDRPVELGAVEQVTPIGVRLGASAIPATATDRDQIAIEAIDVQFNIRDLLSQRKVKLTVTLIQPTIFLDQDQAGNWLNTELALSGEDHIEVEEIRLRNATIELASKAKPMRSLGKNPEAQGISIAPSRVRFEQVNLKLALPNAESQIRFAMAGKATQGGKMRVWGKADLEQETAIVHVRTHQFATTALNPILPPSIRLDAGTLNSTFNVQLQPNHSPAIDGNATLMNGAAQVRKEPNLFTQVNGQLRFQNQQIILDQATLSYGQIPFEQVSGTIHLQNGFDLRAKVNAAKVVDVLHTFKLDVPVAIDGTLRTDDLTVTGPLKRAIFSGTVTDNHGVQVDRLSSAFLGRFRLDTHTDRLHFPELRLTPTVGGEVMAMGEILLGEAAKGEPDQVDLSVQVRELPTDKLAQLYPTSLPKTIGMLNLGILNADATIAVFNQKPSIKGSWQLNQGQFPAQGRLTFANQALHQTAQIQMGNGVLQATGKLSQGQWKLSATGSDLRLDDVDDFLEPTNPFMDQVQLHPAQFHPGQLHQLQLQGELTGSIDRPLESARGTLKADLQSPSGSIHAQGKLAQGQWQALLHSDRFALSRVFPQLPGDVAGEVQLAGAVSSFDLQTLQAKGRLHFSEGLSTQTAILNQPIDTTFQWEAGKLHLQQLAMAGLTANGWIQPNFHGRSPQMTAMDLVLDLQEYDLQSLPLNSPLPLTGLANFQGRLTGTPIQPTLEGTLQLHHLALNQIAFEPTLSGDLNVTADRRVSLNLTGKRDRIELVIDQHQLQALSIQLDQAIAQVVPEPNRRQDPSFLITLAHFPLETLEFSPIESLGAVSGLLSGQFRLRFAEMEDFAEIENPVLTGEVTIDRPAIGGLMSASSPNEAPDRFVGTVQYVDRTLALTEGVLSLGAGQYHLASTLRLPNHKTDSPEVTAHLRTTGTLEDLHSRFQNLPSPFEDVSIPVLSFFSEAAPFVISSPPLPPSSSSDRPILPESGTFSTEISLHHSPQTGLSIAFNLEGEDWVWQDYRIRQVQVANGHFNGTVLSLSSALLQGLVFQPPDRPTQSYETRLTFTGDLTLAETTSKFSPRAVTLHSGTTQRTTHPTAILSVEAVPLALLTQALNLPIPIAGVAEGTFTLFGDVLNPDITGTIAVLDVHLNQRNIKDLQLDFRYHNHQFHLHDWTVIN